MLHIVHVVTTASTLWSSMRHSRFFATAAKLFERSVADLESKDGAVGFVGVPKGANIASPLNSRGTKGLGRRRIESDLRVLVGPVALFPFDIEFNSTRSRLS